MVWVSFSPEEKSISIIDLISPLGIFSFSGPGLESQLSLDVTASLEGEKKGFRVVNWNPSLNYFFFFFWTVANYFKLGAKDSAHNRFIGRHSNKLGKLFTLLYSPSKTSARSLLFQFHPLMLCQGRSMNSGHSLPGGYFSQEELRARRKAPFFL